VRNSGYLVEVELLLLNLSSCNIAMALSKCGGERIYVYAPESELRTGRTSQSISLLTVSRKCIFVSVK